MTDIVEIEVKGDARRQVSKGERLRKIIWMEIGHTNFAREEPSVEMKFAANERAIASGLLPTEKISLE